MIRQKTRLIKGKRQAKRTIPQSKRRQRGGAPCVRRDIRLESAGITGREFSHVDDGARRGKSVIRSDAYCCHVTKYLGKGREKKGEKRGEGKNMGGLGNTSSIHFRFLTDEQRTFSSHEKFATWGCLPRSNARSISKGGGQRPKAGGLESG